MELEKLWNSFWHSIVIAVVSLFCSVVIGTFAWSNMQWYRFRSRGLCRRRVFCRWCCMRWLSVWLCWCSFRRSIYRWGLFDHHCAYRVLFAFCVFAGICQPWGVRFFDCRSCPRSRRNGAADIIQGDNPCDFSGNFIRLFYVGNSVAGRLCNHLFVWGPRATILPLYVFSMVRYGILPVINVGSFIMILGTMLIAFMLRNFLKGIAASN